MSVDELVRSVISELRAVLGNISPYDACARGVFWCDAEITTRMEAALVAPDLIHVNDRIYDFTVKTEDLDTVNSSFAGTISFILYVSDQGQEKVKRAFDYVRAPSANIVLEAEIDLSSVELQTRQEAGQCIVCGDDGEWRSLQLTCRNGHGRICG